MSDPQHHNTPWPKGPDEHGLYWLVAFGKAAEGEHAGDLTFVINEQALAAMAHLEFESVLHKIDQLRSACIEAKEAWVQRRPLALSEESSL